MRDAITRRPPLRGAAVILTEDLETPVWSAMWEVTRWIFRSPAAHVNIAGIGVVRQRLKPLLYCLGINPLWEDQALGLAQSGIETVRAEDSAAGDAVDCDPAQYSREFEGECLEWPRKSCERLGLETFHVDFDKSRLTMTFDQLVQADCRNDEPAGPALTTPSRRRRRRCNKV